MFNIQKFTDIIYRGIKFTSPRARLRIGNFEAGPIHIFFLLKSTEFKKKKKIHFIIFNPLSRCVWSRSCARYFSLHTRTQKHTHNNNACNEIIYTLSRSPRDVAPVFASIIPGVRDFGSCFSIYYVQLGPIVSDFYIYY